MKVYFILSLIASLTCSNLHIMETMQFQLSSKLNLLAENINDLTKIAYYDTTTSNKNSKDKDNKNLNERIPLIEKDRLNPQVIKSNTQTTTLSTHLKDIEENNLFYNTTYTKHEYSLDYFNNTLNYLNQQLNKYSTNDEIKPKKVEADTIQTTNLSISTSIFSDIEYLSDIHINSISNLIDFTRTLSNNCGKDLSQCDFIKRESLNKGSELLSTLQKDISALEFNFKEIAD